MKTMTVLCLLALSLPVFAHHTKNHTMLLENPEVVIAGTRQGFEGVGGGILWFAVLVFLLLGLLRWWQGRS